MRLTIGMPNWDDEEGAWWTLSMIRAYHVPGNNTEIELLVVDDMPTKQPSLQMICEKASARYVHHPKNKGPAHAKDSVWQHAKGEYVLLLDSHVILAPGSIDYIIESINADLIGKDLWTGPLLDETGAIIATQLHPAWRGEFLGIWECNPEIVDKEFIEIFAHGSAYTLMKREHYPFFSPHFRGFAGEEVYLHCKVRDNGGRCLAHKKLAWMHRFFRPKPITYTLTINDKFRNYLVAAYEMGWNLPHICSYFQRKLPFDQYSQVLRDVKAVLADIEYDDNSGMVFPMLD